MTTVQKTIRALADGEKLSAESSEEFFDAVFSGGTSDVELAAVLMAMRVRGETSDEITGAARSMRKAAVKFDARECDHIDTCGTGGDYSQSFNVSSAAALVNCAAGIPVVKHGNRSVTSKSGSADFFEALGLPISLTGEEACEYYKRHQFIFLFAPLYHTAMKYAAAVRKALAVRTIFNYLGPLTNPSFPSKQMIGVYSVDFLEKYANTAMALGFERVLIYSSQDGMDEVSPSAPTTVYEVENGKMSVFSIHPEEFISHNEAGSIPRGCSAAENARNFVDVISSGQETALGKFIALNSALGMYAHKKGDFREYYQNAREIILGGTLLKKVEDLRNGCPASV